jgi:uncharacterized protein YceH (UPF0502 family)
VINVKDSEVQAALDELRSRVLVLETYGASGRVLRYAQNFGRVYGLPPASVALLAILTLRGPQTACELRANAERLYRFDDTSSVEAYLDEMASRASDPLVTRLPRQAGAREHRWAHLLCGAASLPAGTFSAQNSPLMVLASVIAPLLDRCHALHPADRLSTSRNSLLSGVGPLHAADHGQERSRYARPNSRHRDASRRGGAIRQRYTRFLRAVPDWRCRGCPRRDRFSGRQFENERGARDSGTGERRAVWPSSSSRDDRHRPLVSHVFAQALFCRPAGAPGHDADVEQLATKAPLGALQLFLVQVWVIGFHFWTPNENAPAGGAFRSSWPWSERAQKSERAKRHQRLREDPEQGYRQTVGRHQNLHVQRCWIGVVLVG